MPHAHAATKRQFASCHSTAEVVTELVCTFEGYFCVVCRYQSVSSHKVFQAAQLPETVNPYSDHGSPLLMQIQAMGDAARYEMAAGLYLPPTKFAPCSAPYQTPGQSGFVHDCTEAPGFKHTGTSHVNLLAQHG